MSLPSAISTTPLEVIDLTAGYGENIVISDISFTVNKGETLALVGSSGCGKSTVLRCLVGLLEPKKGKVLLFGEDLWEIPIQKRRTLLQRVGLIFQAGALLGSLTVEDNLALPLEMHTDVPPDTIRRLVKARLTQVGLATAAPLKPSELSGGMKKRVAIARSLMLDPELLLCDEPTSGLDPIVAAGIDELLAKARQAGDNAMVIVSHDLESVKRLSDNIIMLIEGRVSARGTFSELSSMEDPVVQAFFQRRPNMEGGMPTSVADNYII